MSDLGGLAVQIWTAVLNEVKKVAGIEDEDIKLGRFWPPEVFPAVYIDPPIIDQAGIRESAGGNQIAFTFIIWLFNDEKGDILSTISNAITMAGKIVTELIDDRTLGGLVETLEEGPIIPMPTGVPAGFERQAVSITINITRWVNAP